MTLTGEEAEPGCSSQLYPEGQRSTETDGSGAKTELVGESTSAPSHGGGKVKKQYSVQIKEPPVSQVKGYEVVKIEEKHGIFHNAIPLMPLPLAVILCLLNIIVPGTGTLLSAPTCLCCPSRLSSRAKATALNVLSALLQMVTFLLIVGWIWSILWGMTMVQLSLTSSRKSKNVNLPYYVRRQSSVESGH